MASATKNIIANGSLYFRMLSFSVPVLFFNACYMAIKGGYGFTKDIMKANIISMIVKFVLNYIFIILMGKGIVYMALSSFIGAASILIYGLVDLNKTKIYQFIEIKHFKFDFVLVKNILIVSIPVIVEKSLISFSFIVINSQVLVYGETVLAAYGITNRINSMFFRVLGGLGSGIATIVSQNFGANKYQRIKDTLKFSMVYAVIISSIFAGLIFLTDNMLVGFLAGDDLVLTNHTLNAISTYSISIIPWAIFQVYLGLFMGLGRTKYNLIISLMRLYLFRLPLIVAFTNFTNFGEYSIWIAMLISNILTGLLGYLVYVFTFKKTIIDKISGKIA
jgi:Na+-driven multidrug efflux pump